MEKEYDDSEAFSAIKSEAVIAAPTPDSEKELFRIYSTDKDDSGITALARPIFLDAAGDTLLLDVRPTNKTGQQALDILTSGTKYSAESDILDVNTSYYVRKNLIEAIASDDENSFLNRWGGEIKYNNYKVIVNKRLGNNNGVKAEFGKILNQ